MASIYWWRLWRVAQRTTDRLERKCRGFRLTQPGNLQSTIPMFGCFGVDYLREDFALVEFHKSSLRCCQLDLWRRQDLGVWCDVRMRWKRWNLISKDSHVFRLFEGRTNSRQSHSGSLALVLQVLNGLAWDDPLTAPSSLVGDTEILYSSDGQKHKRISCYELYVTVRISCTTELSRSPATRNPRIFERMPMLWRRAPQKNAHTSTVQATYSIRSRRLLDATQRQVHEGDNLFEVTQICLTHLLQGIWCSQSRLLVHVINAALWLIVMSSIAIIITGKYQGVNP